jgi:hypothetical protein
VPFTNFAGFMRDNFAYKICKTLIHFEKKKAGATMFAKNKKQRQSHYMISTA